MAASLLTGDPGPLLLWVHTCLYSQRAGPRGKQEHCLSREALSAPLGGQPSGLAGKTEDWQEGPGLQGLRLRLPDRLSCCYGGWGQLPACLCLPVSKVGMLVAKSQKCREVLYLARTGWNLSPQRRPGLAWGALAMTETGPALVGSDGMGVQDGLDTRNLTHSQAPALSQSWFGHPQQLFAGPPALLSTMLSQTLRFNHPRGESTTSKGGDLTSFWFLFFVFFCMVYFFLTNTQFWNDFCPLIAFMHKTTTTKQNK